MNWQDIVVYFNKFVEWSSDLHITSYEYGSLERKEKIRAGLHDAAVDGLE